MSHAAGGLRIAACLYVRDEAPDIAEWLAFHHVVGVDHILVFDNGSRDGTQAVVREASRFASVRLLPWPARNRRAQLWAYALGLRLLRRFDWVAFLDADEFLTPTGDVGLRALLAELPTAAAVAVNWAIFGSCGHDAPPPGLVIEAYTRRAPAAFPENRIVKSIVRPRGARPLTPHTFAVPGAYVRPDGRPAVFGPPAFTADPADYARLQVSHYFTRSREHWRRKMARGYRDIIRPPDAFVQYDRNDVEDLATARLAQRVRAELQRRGQLNENAVAKR